MKQRTIAKAVQFEGIGLHKGQNVHLTIKPAPENHGLVFVKIHKENYHLKVNLENVEGISRGTNLSDGKEVIHTFEHLMAALSSLGLSNLSLEIDADEVPILDGSAGIFYDKLKEVGVIEQEKERPKYRVIRSCSVESDGAILSVSPSKEFKISYTLDYPNTYIGSRHLEINFNQEDLGKKLLKARTFCLLKEVEVQRKENQALGGSLESAVVVDGDKILNKEGLRFENEFSYHKVLDFLGDMNVLGGEVLGSFVGIKSGHRQNITLLKKMIMEGCIVREGDLEENKVLELRDIQKILPHRYPFLLVDRITKLEVGKRATGIKCVTGNEEFFNGHFPDAPVMPGVLIVEALAQVAGVCLLAVSENKGRIPFFMALESVKFRNPTFPGDQLELCIEVDRIRGRAGKVLGVAKVNGKVHVEGKLSFVIK